jgi:hypothetical protein
MGDWGAAEGAAPIKTTTDTAIIETVALRIILGTFSPVVEALPNSHTFTMVC